MKPDEIKKNILKIIAHHKKAVPVALLARELSLQKAARKRLQRWLAEMVNDGELFRDGKGSFSLGSDDDLLAGEVEIMRNGDGLITVGDERRRIRIAQTDLCTAMQGDKILARFKAVVSRGGEDTSYAKVIRVVERAPHDIVGTLRSTGRMSYVVPLDRRYRQDFYIAEPGAAREGDRVVVRFISWADPKLIPEGEIVDVIGPESNASLDTLAVIRQMKIRDEFPDGVISEAEHVAGLLSEPGERMDLRRTMIVTIDPDTARDFDDALSLEEDGNGSLRVGVHIADVSHFVTLGSALDKEARERGNSVYFPDKVVPMLPEQLSNGICSLRPDQDRLTFSVFLKIDSNGVVTGREFAKSIIRSCRRLTYGEALAFLEGRAQPAGKLDKGVAALLRKLSNTAQKLRKRRFAAGALELDVPESEFEIGEDGLIKAIHSVGTDESHQLVEEFMIAANEAVAAKLSECGVEGIYRIHEPPLEERIEELTVELKSLGLTPGNLKTQKGMAAFIKKIQNNPLAHYARIAVLKSMNRAVYSTDSNVGHFGLAKRFYLHFTSPIRRYPDLVAHRQLAYILSLLKPSAGNPRAAGLKETASHCTETENTADQAERSVVEIKKYRFLEAELNTGKPAVRDAVIVKLMQFGAFIELMDLQLQGLVHISTLAKGYSRFNPQAGEIRAGKKSFKVGDTIKVIVSKVDFEQRKVDFVPFFARNSA